MVTTNCKISVRSNRASDDMAGKGLVPCSMSKDGLEWPELQIPPKLDAISALHLGEEKVDKWIQEQLLSEKDKPQDTCIVCGKGIQSSNLVQLACGHQYCTSCIIDLFEFAVYDESSYPPQCCEQRIPVASVYEFLTSKFQRIIQEKETRFRASDRTYCHNQGCSQLLVDSNVKSSTVFCTLCFSETCTSCKAAAHLGSCPVYGATATTIQYVADRKHVQCYRCKGTIECSEDQDHIMFATLSSIF